VSFEGVGRIRGVPNEVLSLTARGTGGDAGSADAAVNQGLGVPKNWGRANPDLQGCGRETQPNARPRSLARRRRMVRAFRRWSAKRITVGDQGHRKHSFLRQQQNQQRTNQEASNDEIDRGAGRRMG